MNEQLEKNGTITSISNVEVTSVSRGGFVLSVKGKEYYVSYENFPYFRNARISEIFEVELKGRERLRWEALDIDLTTDIIMHPENYPLKGSA